jgi:hypothetical protein
MPAAGTNGNHSLEAVVTVSVAVSIPPLMDGQVDRVLDGGCCAQIPLAASDLTNAKTVIVLTEPWCDGLK